MAAIVQLLLLACTAGVWLVQAQTTCTEAGKRSCSNCATVSLCDKGDNGTLTESLSGCSVGQLCDDSAGVPACYLLASAPSGAQCKCKKNGKMADPFDPSWYVLCMGTSQYSIKCLDDQVFDEATGNCIIAPTTEPTTTMTPLECGDVPGPAVVPDTGCKSYFACIPLDPTDFGSLSPTEVQQCPGCQLFDTSSATCVDQTFACEENDGAIADNLNCTIYHTCLGGTELGEVINCKSGEIFDGQNGKCITGDVEDAAICPPISLCIDSTSICSDTSSTTTPISSSTISKASSDPTSSASSGASSDPSAPGSSSSSPPLPPPSSSPSSPPPSSPAPSSPSPPPPSSSSSPSPPSISTTSATTIAATTSSGIPDCSVDGGQPFPGDCTKYYYCIGGKPVLQKCPGITLFDSATKLCVLPADATGCN